MRGREPPRSTSFCGVLPHHTSLRIATVVDDVTVGAWSSTPSFSPATPALARERPSSSPTLMNAADVPSSVPPALLTELDAGWPGSCAPLAGVTVLAADVAAARRAAAAFLRSCARMAAKSTAGIVTRTTTLTRCSYNTRTGVRRCQPADQEHLALVQEESASPLQKLAADGFHHARTTESADPKPKALPKHHAGALHQSKDRPSDLF
jgi:hypothetical protein